MSFLNTNRRCREAKWVFTRSALFTVLHDATHDLRELRGQELADRAKYAELVMKVSRHVSFSDDPH